MAANEYYFANGNEQKGPYSKGDFVALGLRPDTLVWREGLPEWQRLDALPEKAELIPPAHPAPTPAIGRPAPPPAAQAPLNPQPPITPGISALGYEGFRPNEQLQPSGMSIASMVLGIVACVSFCGFHVGLFAGFPCSILAIIFGFIARGKVNRGEAGGAGQAKAGLILGFIYLGLWVLIFTAIVIVAIVLAIKSPTGSGTSNH